MRTIDIKTVLGTLSATTTGDPGYPGISISLNDEVYGVIEVYEEDRVLKARLYREDDEEPSTLVVLYKDEDSE